ncbi:hypothetical protein M1139_00570 [Candidatus Parvarchaeota archaeon]|jgi:hypothetical protein|nr:hypothetical protein [Candidatus Parvarchaeota archaeon]
MKTENIKSLADLIYDPHEKAFLSRQAVVGIAERFYNRLGNPKAEQFTKFYKSNKEKTKKIFEEYLNSESFSSIFNSLIDGKALQNLIYRNLLKVEKNLRENSYDIKKVFQNIEEKTDRDYTDF